MSKNLYALSFSIIAIMSCSDGSNSGNTDTSSSATTNYTTASVLGSNINDTTATDTGPEVSANGLELYFQSNRANGAGGLDLYVSTRSSPTDTWGPATSPGAVINTLADERAVSLSNDGLTMIFASNRSTGFGNNDLYTSTRTDLNSAWSTPVNMGNVINTQFNESGSSLSDNGLILYFHSNVPGGSGNNDIYVSTRASTLDPWAPPVNLGIIVNSAGFDTAPEISSDGLSLYFHSDRSGGSGNNDIWRATRASINDIWGSPAALPSPPINSAVNDVAPGLSNDAQELYFGSDANGSRDIWKAVP